MGAGFRVIDTGIGIAKDDQARMLEPFTQVESGLSRKHEGTGLGLPLCRALIEVHDGTLSIESDLGTGTAIIVTLPEERISEKRSEEHTSELQSLMRISYAVFCLKKKTIT